MAKERKSRLQMLYNPVDLKRAGAPSAPETLHSRAIVREQDIHRF